MNDWTNDLGIVLVDHGSRRPEANALLERIAEAFARSQGAPIVAHAHMELADPTVAQAVAHCVKRGATRVVIQLFFLSPGRHSQEDIPRLAKEAVAAHPGVQIALSSPLGEEAGLLDVLASSVRKTMEGKEWT